MNIIINVFYTFFRKILKAKFNIHCVMVLQMSDSGKLIASSKLGVNYSFILPKRVREILKVQTGDVIGFYLGEDNLVMLSIAGEKLLGSANLTANNSLTIPKLVRDKYDFENKTIIGFYLKENGKISIQLS